MYSCIGPLQTDRSTDNPLLPLPTPLQSTQSLQITPKLLRIYTFNEQGYEHVIIGMSPLHSFYE